MASAVPAPRILLIALTTREAVVKSGVLRLKTRMPVAAELHGDFALDAGTVGNAAGCSAR